jgi:aspartyl-tRNA(Asn)/glutamyl-tRNA(Gln) amidotransferase subunit A
MSLENWTVGEAAAAIRSGATSPLEYAQVLLDRIDKLDPAIRAWVTVDHDAVIKQANACQREAREGRFRGALHGVPLGVKDIFYTTDLPTTAGASFLQSFVPSYDAACVAQLRRAGAIILGKTVTTEFATFDPGPTRNPWNTNHTPGGSSSGSAAAVAAGMCPAATGTQTVASVGRPAAYCGVVGFMPTQARISRAGIFPVSWSLDHAGTFSRGVADARILFAALSGRAVETSPRPDRLRLGILRGFFSQRASAETRNIYESTVRRLEQHPFVLEEVVLPPVFDFHVPILMTIMRAEIASAHTGFYRYRASLYSKKLRALVETGLLLDSATYLRALRLRTVYRREMMRLFEKFDLLISPGAMDTAPAGLEFTGDPGFSAPWSLADFPTLSLPAAVATNGLPFGVQVSAPPMQEGLLLDVGESIETLLANSPP